MIDKSSRRTAGRINLFLKPENRKKLRILALLSGVSASKLIDRYIESQEIKLEEKK